MLILLYVYLNYHCLVNNRINQLTMIDKEHYLKCIIKMQLWRKMFIQNRSHIEPILFICSSIFFERLEIRQRTHRVNILCLSSSRLIFRNYAYNKWSSIDSICMLPLFTENKSSSCIYDQNAFPFSSYGFILSFILSLMCGIRESL